MTHLQHLRHLLLRGLFAVMLSTVMLGQSANAQTDPFERGWTLQPEMSSLNFQSVKKQTVVESSGFATMEGTIGPDGQTEVVVLLDSVDTKIDLRNVRMRFLFFETFNFPTATITTKLDAALLDDLATLRRKTIPITYSLNLHGVSQTLQAEVTATLLGPDLVSVTARTPISISVSDFDLMGGLEKLEEAASVDIIPSATVSFDFVFARNSTTAQVAPVQAPRVAPASAALEAEGDFDSEACKGRFEILSRTGNIYFQSGFSRLEDRSEPLLNSLADIVARCPDMVIEIGGYTDSIGSAASNQRLSEARAGSVTRFLLARNIPADRLISKGYGEENPVASNDTAEGQAKNRRIEFKVLSN